MTLSPGGLIGAITGGLFLLYLAVRLAGKAWFRSRREHLTEISTLFGKHDKRSAPNTPRIPLKSGEDEHGN
jgi:hypothetical protein